MEYSGQPMSQAGDMGRVVMCSAKDCAYNQAAKCVAESVHVNRHQDHADCNTYTNNRHPAQMTEEKEGM
ncbi:MAG: DUF1540 domain-containing protein [Armatimonadota bacterium]|nr:DUF1540 domain-containing protein [Armatimonadota bacterium]